MNIKLKNKTRQNKGITLIALVVTIIVLLILAGVSIQMITGQYGILDKAREAADETNKSTDLEYLQTEALGYLIDYYNTGEGMSEREYVLGKLKDAGIIDSTKIDESAGTFEYNGKTYNIEEVIGKSSEAKALASNGMKEVEKAGTSWAENNNIRSVVTEEGKEDGLEVPIPKRFYYVTGTPETGVVISDVDGDDDNNSKGGNQFVWVPCYVTTNGELVEGEEKVEGAVAYDTKLAYTWKKQYSTHQDNYKNYTWKDEGGNSDSVRIYGGFYIGRYEAGLPENSALWSNYNGATYGGKSGERNSTSMTPVSKKNNAVWNSISQKNALEVSKSMYASDSSVTSQLINSYAWDTVVEWIKESAASDFGVIDSTKYGNYLNSEININGLYAEHYTKVMEDGVSRWASLASSYKKGKKTTTSRKQENEQIQYEIGTGTSEDTKTKNIYDLAGNMWEWTTEVKDNQEAVVLRGGCCSDLGSDHPVVFRNGVGGAETLQGVHIGFRVVLYIIV